MPDGPRKASLRAPTMMERIKSGLQDTLGIPERVWGMPMPDEAIRATRGLQEAKAAKGPVLRAPTTLERIQEGLRPVTNVLETLGSPLENAEMGPAKAITLVTKKPLTDLLRRLHPRNAQGMMVDPAEFPNITSAVQEAVERYPRVASHLNSIDTTLSGDDFGMFVVPNQFTKQIRSMGADRFKDTWGAPVAKIQLNPVVEGINNEAINTVFHEFGHGAQYIMDPRRFDGTYDAATDRLVRSLPNLAYALNPAETAARAIARRNVARAQGGVAEPYRRAIQQEYEGTIGGPASIDAYGEMSKVWGNARTAFVKEMERQGVPLKPRF